MLHTPHRNSGSSRYCGPTAMMCVTGLPGSVIVDAVRQVRGNILSASGARMPVSGVSNKDLLATMDLLGWAVEERYDEPSWRRVKTPDPRGKWHDGHGGRFSYHREWDGEPPQFFADFLADRGSGGPYIVNVTGHYMAVSQGEVCDAATTVLPTDIPVYLKRGKFSYRQAWIRHWWRFEKIADND